MRTNIVLLTLLFVPLHARAQQRPPILDMHVHALHAHDQGPPPIGLCSPIDQFSAWDPTKPYIATMMKLSKEPPCDDPLWSPMTDAELMELTLAMMERLNVIGGVSGSAARVDTWRAAAPERVIPGLFLKLDDATPSPESLRRLHQSRKLAVLGEVLTQ